MTKFSSSSGDADVAAVYPQLEESDLACAPVDVDPRWFDVESSADDHALARVTCRVCPGKAACLRRGMAIGESGIYGGHLLIRGVVADARAFSDEDCRRMHTAHVTGDTSDLVRDGEREYQRRAKDAARRAQASAA